MSDKSHAQKAYEKAEMVRRNPDKINVMIASNSIGQYSLALMVDTAPIGLILHEPNDLIPEFAKSEILKKAFAEAGSVDTRTTPDDFDNDNTLVSEIIDNGISNIEMLIKDSEENI
tara:strand:- start:3622 stop:3969 length:348 start_codon:yes stop_codon:yes gene_type:complete